MKIEPKPMRGGEMEKRTYLPFALTSTCPKCGRDGERDLTDQYLSYPVLGQPQRVTFRHDDADDDEANCANEWHGFVVIGFTLTEVEP